MVREEKTAGGEAIAGNRRQDKRYALQLDIKWKLIRRKRVLETGTGQTIDISSGGILFDAGRLLPEGLDVELSITWPALLHNVSPIQLVTLGRIVRSVGRKVALKTAQHEFRTVAVLVEQPSVTAEQRSVSAEQRSVPAEQRSVPAEQRSVPVQQRSVAAGQRSVAAGQRSVPAEQRSVPIDASRTPRF